MCVGPVLVSEPFSMEQAMLVALLHHHVPPRFNQQSAKRHLDKPSILHLLGVQLETAHILPYYCLVPMWVILVLSAQRVRVEVSHRSKGRF